MCYLNLDLTTILLESELRLRTTKKIKTKFVFLRLNLFYNIASWIVNFFHKNAKVLKPVQKRFCLFIALNCRRHLNETYFGYVAPAYMGTQAILSLRL